MARRGWVVQCAAWRGRARCGGAWNGEAGNCNTGAYVRDWISLHNRIKAAGESASGLDLATGCGEAVMPLLVSQGFSLGLGSEGICTESCGVRVGTLVACFLENPPRLLSLSSKT